MRWMKASEKRVFPNFDFTRDTEIYRHFNIVQLYCLFTKDASTGCPLVALLIKIYRPVILWTFGRLFIAIPKSKGGE